MNWQEIGSIGELVSASLSSFRSSILPFRYDRTRGRLTRTQRLHRRRRSTRVLLTLSWQDKSSWRTLMWLASIWRERITLTPCQKKIDFDIVWFSITFSGLCGTCSHRERLENLRRRLGEHGLQLLKESYIRRDLSGFGATTKESLVPTSNGL